MKVIILVAGRRRGRLDPVTESADFVTSPLEHLPYQLILNIFYLASTLIEWEVILSVVVLCEFADILCMLIGSV